MNIIIVAECDELWNRLHKIRCQVQSTQVQSNEDEEERDVTAVIEIKNHILNYVRMTGSDDSDFCNDSNIITDENIHVHIHNPDDGGMKLLRDLKFGGSNAEFFRTYGTRIRCTIEYQTTSGVVSADGQIGMCRKESPLMIKGRYFEYSPDGVQFAGKTLVVEEVPNNQVDGTGLNVWDGSLLLARYLERVPDKIKFKSVLELGSGPAFVGIAAAVLGAADVVLSDLKYTLPLIRRNVELNRRAIDEVNCKRVECMLLDWFNPPPIDALFETGLYPEVMLIADCVWVEELVNPLMDTVEQLCGEDTLVMITYQRRGKAAHDLFWQRLEQIFTRIEMIDTKERFDLEKPESIHLIHCQR